MSFCGYDVIVSFFFGESISLFGYDNVQGVFWLVDSFQKGKKRG